MWAFPFPMFFLTRIFKISKMSASPIAHTVFQLPLRIMVINHRVAACGVAIF